MRPLPGLEALNVDAPTILVVEDSDVIRRVIGLILEGAGYRVSATDRASVALDLARRDGPDAVILDLALVDGDGRDVLRRLKQDPATESIPVVVISAFSDALNSAERWYVADVIPKPFDVDDLLGRLRRAVDPDRPNEADEHQPMRRETR